MMPKGHHETAEVISNKAVLGRGNLVDEPNGDIHSAAAS